MQYQEDSVNLHSSKSDANTDMSVKNKQDATNNSQRKNDSSRSLIVVKIGGSTFGSDDTTVADLVKLQKQGFLASRHHSQMLCSSQNNNITCREGFTSW